MTDTTDTTVVHDGEKDLREQVRAKYAAKASNLLDRQEAAGGCETTTSATGTGDQQVGVDDGFGAAVYGTADKNSLPATAVQASMGCGNPLVVADLHEGETVLDLGSGGGIDVLLSARRVGPTGKAYGVDMAEEMLELARRNTIESGLTNVEFLRGHIEDIPLPDNSVDVIISNCVINLSVDKSAVLASIHRVLRPGGRIGISDVISDDRLTPHQRAERSRLVGCIAGALSETEYRDGLSAAGFIDIEITRTHEALDGIHSGIIKAVKRALHRCDAPR